MKSKTLFLKTIINELDFLKKISCNSMKHLNRKDILLFAHKLVKNMPDLGNAKEHYQSLIRKKTENQLYNQK